MKVILSKLDNSIKKEKFGRQVGTLVERDINGSSSVMYLV